MGDARRRKIKKEVGYYYLKTLIACQHHLKASRVKVKHSDYILLSIKAVS
jgi:hypothetical protein